MWSETVAQCVRVHDDAPSRVRARHGLAPDRRLRIAFVAGPGDAAGTFEHWLDGRFDPRTPVIAYSCQFYTLVESIDADALVLTEPDTLPVRHHPRFRFVRTPRRRDLRKARWHFETWRFARAVLTEIRAFDPDVVVIGTDAPSRVLRRLPGSARLILTAHNTFWPMGRRGASLRERLDQALRARVLRRISAAVCTSPECGRQIIELTGRNHDIFVQTPQVLLRHADDRRTREAVRQVVYVGRIEPEKGVFDLLDAFDGIAGRYPSIELTMAGSGSALEPLRAKAATARHGSRIHLPGQLSADQVHAALARADLLVCPTRTDFLEGLGVVVVEAAIHGVPALLSSVVPAKDLFAGAAAEFPADDVEALRSALDSLVGSPEHYRQLCQALTTRTDVFFDRSRSWGSRLYEALLAGQTY